MTKTQRSLALWAALGATLVAASAWALWPKPLTLELVHPHRDTLRVQRTDQGTTRVRDLFTELREPTNPGACGSCGSYDACGGGCMATKFFTGLPLDAPDPECVFGHGETALAELEANGGAIRPTVSVDHSKPVGVGKKRIPVSIL